MAGYIQWLAPRLDQVRAGMSAAHARYREQAAHAGLHRRTPGIVADLFIGWQQFFTFAHQSGALTRDEADGHRARVNAELNCHFFGDADVPRLTNSLFLAPRTIAGYSGETKPSLRRMI